MESGEAARTGLYLVPWTCDTANEDAIQEDCKATIRQGFPPPVSTAVYL